MQHYSISIDSIVKTGKATNTNKLYFSVEADSLQEAREQVALTLKNAELSFGEPKIVKTDNVYHPCSEHAPFSFKGIRFQRGEVLNYVIFENSRCIEIRTKEHNFTFGLWSQDYEINAFKEAVKELMDATNRE